MKRILSLLLCLCLAASLVGSLDVVASADTSPEARDLIILYTSDVHCSIDKGGAMPVSTPSRKSSPRPMMCCWWTTGMPPRENPSAFCPKGRRSSTL